MKENARLLAAHPAFSILEFIHSFIEGILLSTCYVTGIVLYPDQGPDKETKSRLKLQRMKHTLSKKAFRVASHAVTSLNETPGLFSESCIVNTIILCHVLKIFLRSYFNFTQTQHFYNRKMLIFSAQVVRQGKYGRCF